MKKIIFLSLIFILSVTAKEQLPQYKLSVAVTQEECKHFKKINDKIKKGGEITEEQALEIKLVNDIIKGIEDKMPYLVKKYKKPCTAKRGSWLHTIKASYLNKE